MNILDPSIPLELTSDNDSLIYNPQPDASPEGYKDAKVKKSVLLQEVNTSLTDLDNRVSINEFDIAELQDFTAIVRRSSDAVDFQETQPANSFVTIVAFLVESGTVTVKVGTSDGGDDVVSERTLGVAGSTRYSNIAEYTELARTLYFTITGGGQVATTIKYEKNFFDI